MFSFVKKYMLSLVNPIHLNNSKESFMLRETPLGLFGEYISVDKYPHQKTCLDFKLDHCRSISFLTKEIHGLNLQESTRFLDFFLTLTDKNLPDKAIRIPVEWIQCGGDKPGCFYVDITNYDHHTVRMLVRKLLREWFPHFLSEEYKQRKSEERRKKREMRKTALAMALHPRLGAGSPLKALSNDLLQLVIKFT
jgi:hypothetical protein